MQVNLRHRARLHSPFCVLAGENISMMSTFKSLALEVDLTFCRGQEQDRVQRADALRLGGHKRRNTAPVVPLRCFGVRSSTSELEATSDRTRHGHVLTAIDAQQATPVPKIAGSSIVLASSDLRMTNKTTPTMPLTTPAGGWVVPNRRLGGRGSSRHGRMEPRQDPDGTPFRIRVE